MSKTSFDNDGFQIVKSKRTSRNKQTKLPNKQINFIKEEVAIDIKNSLRRIQLAVENLRSSDYLENVIKSVSSILQNRKVVEIVCFGLGHVSECRISRHQLALLLCFKDIFDPNKVLVHDPIFYKDECKVFTQLGVQVIDQNDEGSYVTTDKGLTIVYLPHCPKQLTNNFLWSNWGLNLQNCVILCNSFSSLIENQPSRILLATVPYIYKLFPFTFEVKIDNCFTYTDIFNDTSIHYFSKEKLEDIDPNFWIKDSKPTYDDTEEFITKEMVKKLNIFV